MLMGRGRKWYPPSSLMFMEPSFLLGIISKKVIISGVCATGIFRVPVSTLSAPASFACLLSRSSAVPLSQPSLLTFKFLGFKSHWMQELKKLSPSSFTSKWLWRNIFLLHSFACSSLSCLSLCQNCENLI